jgi:solute carrier family 25 protein 39/40
MMEVKAESTLKKAAAASSGALLTSLFVTPLDVAKVRIQSQIHTGPIMTLADLRVTHSSVATAVATAAEQCRCHTRCVCNRSVTRPVGKLQASRRGGKALPAMRMSCSRSVAAPLQLQGTSHALRHIFQTEGLKGLFAGLSPAMVIAVPSTVLYYMSYDLLLHEGRQRFPEIDGLAPLMAGTTARIVAASITSPIELIRTRMQGDKAGASILATFQQAVRRGGYVSLLNGLGATLARDVPFSAIYWTSYENLQRRLNTAEAELTRTQRAFACGAVSGAIAATVTTPFDVVKTLQQVSMTAQGSQPSGATVLRQVVASKGVSGAFTGLTARLARVAPSCAIMISCYELGKEKLGIE